MRMIQEVLRRLTAAALCVGGLCLPAHGPAWAAGGDEVRPEVMKALQAAQEAVKAGQGAQALLRIREAQAVAQPSAQERYLTSRMLAVAASLAGEPAEAVRAFEDSLASGRVPAPERLGLWQATVQSAQRAGDAQAVVRAGRAYLAEGGQDLRLQVALAQALGVLKDPGGMVQVLEPLVQADEVAGRASSETVLKLLASGHVQLGDEARYVQTLEKLLRVRADPAYWADLIARRRARPEFPPALQLDAVRLAGQVAALRSREAYLEWVQLAVQAGQPAEAQAAFEAGVAAGWLGQGPQAESDRRQGEGLRKAQAQDRADFAASEAAARQSGDGAALCALGQAAVAMGQWAQGLALMDAALAKGMRRQAEECRLRRAVARWRAGQGAEAQAEWTALQATAAPDIRWLAAMWQLAAGAQP